MSHPRHSEPLPLGTPDQPYSKGLMARALVAVGVPLGRAYELAKRIDQYLFDRGEQSIELEQVQELAVEVLGDDEGSEAVRRLRRFRELHELDLPIIVLVGGATGTGKSTVATEAAYRLGITRVTSTDFIRQTMRAFFSKEFMPSIHYSSFEAAAGLREQGGDIRALASRLVSQAEAVPWRGKAADSMRERIKERAHHLRTAAAHHETAADSLAKHLVEVDRLKETIDTRAHKATSLVEDARTRVAHSAGPDGAPSEADDTDTALLAFDPPPAGHKDWLTVSLPGL